MQFQEIKEANNTKVITIVMADKASVAVVKIQLARKVFMDQAESWQSKNKKVVNMQTGVCILQLFLVSLPT